MVAYEQRHSDLLEPVEREQQFVGPTNIAGGLLRKMTKHVLVPAVREASEEVEGRQSSIYKLLEMLVVRRVNAREDVRRLRADFEKRFRET